MTPHTDDIAAIIVRERARLLGFIRRRVPNAGDAEDILQDVLFEFTQAWALPEPIEQVGAWLARVARNRIIDRFRKKREESWSDASGQDDDEAEYLYLEEALPDPDGGPEAAYMRAMLLEAISNALDELPPNERDVFIGHELEGLSFQDMATHSGTNVNTLLGWKRRAVLHLRNRLQPFYDELT
ncbi:sigma-70 family RNA polymerase sigma factor [Curvibacter sp. CHRR-16]|uniref:RNA polymerase sigma factor n=1 Tax=Curvibacter sp. CHRR-16 TaxID=2835872 RepID=UPI001BD989E1|nr:sigma-70 family RNA polymerase sigma factor [Curvibacter sp. CHRR-16]MBT0570550.1 sigma-70 family RNA polymerase sigma factor [Curvibacter sp. CHRR-16]